MKFLKRKTDDDPLDHLIDGVLHKMHTVGENSEQYPDLMESLERLYELKAKSCPKPMSRDTIAIVAGNLLGILLIVAYEQKHVMTSKGFNQILRPKSPNQL